MTLSEPKKTLDALLEHREFVASLARRWCKDPVAAEDLEQEAWLAALHKPPGTMLSPRGWLSQVVRNLAIGRSRDSRRRAEREARATERAEAPAPDLEFDRELLRDQLSQAIVELPALERQVIELHFGESLSLSEIARRLGISAKRARQLTTRGCERMRRRLRSDGSNDWSLALLPGLRGLWRTEPATLALRVALVLTLIPLGTLFLRTLAPAPTLAVDERATLAQEDRQGDAAGATPVDTTLEDLEWGAAPRDLEMTLLLAAKPVEAVGELNLDLTVLDPWNQPCPNAEVFSAPLEDAAPHTVLGVSDEDGRLRASGVDPRSWIGATHAKWGPTMLLALPARVRVDQQIGAIQLSLSARPKVFEGSIVDEQGQPVAGAALALQYRGEPLPRIGLRVATETLPPGDSSVSDQNGRFELRSMRRTSQVLLVSHPEFAVHRVPVRRTGKRSTLEITLRPPITVTGQVTNIFGEPAPAVTVAARLAWSGELTTTTDSQGRFELHQLPADAHVLTATGATFEARGEARQVIEALPGTRVEWSPRLDDERCISGRVRGLADGDETQWRVMLEVEGAHATPGPNSFLVERAGARFSTLDADGAFAFSACEEKPNRLTLQRLRGDGSTWPIDAHEEVLVGTQGLLLDSTLEVAPATLRGRLGATSPDDAVILLTTPVCTTSRRVATNPVTKAFFVQDLPPGEYRLWASTLERALIPLLDSREILLSPGEELELGALELPEACSIVFDFEWPNEDDRQGSVTVVSEQTGVQMTVGLETLRRHGEIGVEPTFELGPLEAGEYLVSIVHQKRLRSCRLLQLQSGQRETLRVDMGTGRDVRFECPPDSALTTGGLISLDLGLADGPMLKRLTIEPRADDPDSWSRVTSLPPGEYAIHASDLQGRSAHTTFPVEADPSPLRVVVDPR